MKINNGLEKYFYSSEPRKIYKLFCLAGFILLFSTLNVFSQMTHYTIIGRVVDENGQPISRADVRISPIKTYIMDKDDNLTNQMENFLLKEKWKKVIYGIYMLVINHWE